MDTIDKGHAMLSTVLKIHGKEMSYHQFREDLEEVKVYMKSSHKDRILYKDKEGNFWLYDFDEYVTFSDHGDLMNEVYALMGSEEEAERHSASPVRVLRTKPHIHIDDTMRLHQYNIL